MRNENVNTNNKILSKVFHLRKCHEIYSVPSHPHVGICTLGIHTQAVSPSGRINIDCIPNRRKIQIKYVYKLLLNASIYYLF